jgi:hypothetical protein
VPCSKHHRRDDHGPQLHPGTAALIRDYLEAPGHGTDDNGALFRPIKNTTTSTLERAITADGVYKLVRAYSALLGFEIGAHATLLHGPPYRLGVNFHDINGLKI